MNTPWNVIDQDGQEKIVWESRSMASAVFAFTKDKEGNYRVLAVKRGSGCPNHVGEWCFPCGYLDYNETLRNAAYRECKEETGVMLPEIRLKLFKLNDDPMDEAQVVTAIFYCEVVNGFDYSITNKYGEPNEVDEVAWIRLDLLDNFTWAFNHKDLIKKILFSRIYIPWWKRILLKLYEKYL